MRGGRRNRRRGTAEAEAAGGHAGERDSGGLLGGTADRRQPLQPQPQSAPREFEVPKVPREWIARKSEAAKQNLDRVVQSGAGQEKVRRAEEKKRRMDNILKQAGGPPDKDLHFEIKGEIERKRKAARTFEQLQSKKQELHEKIKDLQEQIQEVEAEQEACKRRHEVAGERLEYLAAQQLASAMPRERIERLRTAAAAVVQSQGQNDADALLDLVAVMVPPPPEIDIASGETSEDDGDGSDATRLDLEDEGPPGGGGVPLAEPASNVRRDLHDARNLLTQALADRREAMEDATEAQRRRAGKRTLDGGAAGAEDGGGDVEMVPPLDPEQAAKPFDLRIEMLEGQIRHMEDRLRGQGEQVQPLPMGGGEGDGAGGPAAVAIEGGMRDGQPAASSGLTWGERFEARFETAEARDQRRELAHEVEDKSGEVRRQVAQRRAVAEANEAIMAQHRMQTIQDEETLGMLAAQEVAEQYGALGIASASEARRERAQLRTFRNLIEAHGNPADTESQPATFGPTGSPLNEMQTTMRQSCQSAGAVVGGPRWDRAQRLHAGDEAQRGRAAAKLARRSLSPRGSQPQVEGGARGARSKSPRGRFG